MCVLVSNGLRPVEPHSPQRHASPSTGAPCGRSHPRPQGVRRQPHITRDAARPRAGQMRHHPWSRQPDQNHCYGRMGGISSPGTGPIAARRQRGRYLQGFRTALPGRSGNANPETPEVTPMAGDRNTRPRSHAALVARLRDVAELLDEIAERCETEAAADGPLVTGELAGARAGAYRYAARAVRDALADEKPS